MIDVSVIRDLVAIFGVIAGFSYYVITVRNTNRARRKDIIFQSQAPRSPEYYAIFNDVVKMRDYSTRKEYVEKYSEEEREKANYLYVHFNMLGVLFMDGIASAGEIFQLYPPHAIMMLWEVIERNIRDMRVDTKNPDFLKPFESLYHEARRRYPDYVPYWKRL